MFLTQKRLIQKNKKYQKTKEMNKTCILSFLVIFTSWAENSENKKKLAAKILADLTMPKVDEMARELMKKGFYAGSGYQMVWSRDMNTIIDISCQVYAVGLIRDNLLLFVHFHQQNGAMLDG